jgi:hypothetical protein
METLGHSQISLPMDTYSHVIPALQREAADRMEALLADHAWAGRRGRYLLVVVVVTTAVPVTTFPMLSTAMQKSLLGQDTPDRLLEPSTLVIVQAEAPPVGLLEVTTLPLSSTATQEPLLVQETPFR